VHTQVSREAKLNLEAVEPSELAQIEGGGIWFAVFAIGVGIAAGQSRAREDAAREASEMSAVLGALKQGGII
jgi:hypothetical protein